LERRAYLLVDFIVFDDREGLLLVFQCVVHCDINGEGKGAQAGERSFEKQKRARGLQ
jgi:hypothetical protein